MYGARILIAEDDGIISAHLASTLQKLGYQVVAETNDGEEVITMAASLEVDLVLMDVTLGGPKDGIEIAAELLAKRGPPVVLLTAHADPTTIARAKAARAVGYLTKPFQDASLATTIEIGLEQRAVSLRLEASERTAREAEARARALAEHYATLLRMASDGIHIVDESGKVVDVSDTFCRMLGYSRDELLTMRVDDWDVRLSADERSARLAELSASTSLSFETRHTRKDGTVLDVEIRGRGVTIDGQRLIYASARDITAEKRASRELEEASLTDALTGLHNRRGFMLLADQQLKLAVRRRTGLVVFFLDVNGMKAINDTLGHRIGDMALVETASLLRRVFRVSDVLARLGGDEFVALATDAAATDEQAVSRRIAAELSRRSAGPTAFPLSFSIGAAVFDPVRPVPLEALLADADARMYTKKELRYREVRRDSVADDLKRAVGAHGLWVAHLRDVIDTGVSDLTLEGVGDAAACEFGRWLAAAGGKQPAGVGSRAAAVVQLHKEFHALAAEVLRLALGQHREEALRYLDHDGDFTRVSQVLLRELNAWFAEGNIAPLHEDCRVPSLPPASQTK